MISKERQKQVWKGGFAVGAVIIIAVLICVIIYLLLSRNTEVKEERRNVVISSGNVEDVLEELNEIPDVVVPGYYTVTMNTTWHFKKGSEASYDAVVENVEANTNDVYFDIVLESDESVVLYESPVIPRGARLENIVLDKALEPGNYSCVVIYHLIDEEQNTLSTLRVTLKIIIEG